jgi:hypothetical protein
VRRSPSPPSWAARSRWSHWPSSSSATSSCSRYRNRIWEAAQSLSEEQRLLHWKARNLLLFLVGMIIVSAMLGLFGVFDDFVNTVLTQ